VLDYFSYEHFYVLYCKFWELDADHDFLLDRDDLVKFCNYFFFHDLPFDRDDLSSFCNYIYIYIYIYIYALIQVYMLFDIYGSSFNIYRSSFVTTYTYICMFL